MSTLTLKELSAPTGEVIKIAAGKTLDLKSQGSVTMPTGSVLQVVAVNPSGYASTVTYSSTSLTPMAQITVTAKSANSKFLINWSAEWGRDASGRSQFLLSDSYSAGVNNYSAGNHLFYSHFGNYHAGGGFKMLTSYSYYDESKTLGVGASVTYYIFGGPIGSATDTAYHQRLQVMEIAQ